MSKTTASVLKVQKMMNQMQINDEMCAPSKSTTSDTIGIMPLSPSQQQKQRNRSRFFYRLRQEKKKKRLQSDSLPIHHQQQQYTQQTKRNNQCQKREILGQYISASSKEQNKTITGIIGSSIARNISVENIENSTNEIRLRFKSGSNCADALDWIQSNEGQIFMKNVNQLIFILATNDLHRVGADETVRRIEYTVERIRCLYPSVKIIWQLLQRRTKKTWLLPEGLPVLREIEKCNIQLLQLATRKWFDTIQPDIPVNEMYDGLHPTSHGVRMMEATIRQYLNKNKMVNSTSSNIPSLFQIVVRPPPLMSINF